MKIMVVGSTGFVGKALVEELLQRGHEVTGVGTTHSRQTHPSYTHLQLEGKALQMEHMEDHEAVVNLAWRGSVGPLRDSSPTQWANVALAEHLLLTSSQAEVPHFLMVGTITEEEVPHHDLSQGVPGPGYFYGLMKRVAHEVCAYRAAQEGVKFTWARLGNCFQGNDATERILPATFRRMLRGEPVSFTSTGLQPYDFVAVEVAAQALAALVEAQAVGTYYVGSGRPQTFRKFMEDLAEVTDYRGALTFGGQAGVALPWDSFSIEDLEAATTFKPSASFQEALEEALALQRHLVEEEA